MVWAGIHHDGRTALVRVFGALSAQIYRDEILQHHVTGGIFRHDNARPLTVFSAAKQRSCLTMSCKIGRFIPIRTPLGHPKSQISSKE